VGGSSRNLFGVDISRTSYALTSTPQASTRQPEDTDSADSDQEDATLGHQMDISDVEGTEQVLATLSVPVVGGEPSAAITAPLNVLSNSLVANVLDPLGVDELPPDLPEEEEPEDHFVLPDRPVSPPPPPAIAEPPHMQEQPVPRAAVRGRNRRPQHEVEHPVLVQRRLEFYNAEERRQAEAHERRMVEFRQATLRHRMELEAGAAQANYWRIRGMREDEVRRLQHRDLPAIDPSEFGHAVTVEPLTADEKRALGLRADRKVLQYGKISKLFKKFSIFGSLTLKMFKKTNIYFLANLFSKTFIVLGNFKGFLINERYR